MDQSSARRDALRIFRLVLAVKLAFFGLTFLTILGLGGPARLGLLLRAGPTLLLAMLVLPPWLERALGRRFLAAGLGLDVLIESLESASAFFDLQGLWMSHLNLPSQMTQHLAEGSLVEPFFFLLIPLVLLAWGYGRRGALWGSTWATALHLGIGLWGLQQDILARRFFLGAFLRIVLLYAVPLMVSILAQRERRQHAELEAAYKRLHRHAATVEQLAVSRERNRLARDLHDTLAHSLAAIAVQLEALRTLLVHDAEAAEGTVDDLLHLARSGLDDSRKAIQALRTDRLETLGLVGAVRDMLQPFQARTGIQANLSVAGQEPDLTGEEAQALFRIAEEALTNVELHAAAQKAAIRLAFGSDRIDLEIQDDGVGFDLGAVDPDRYGLTGMQERAAMIGATLEVSSRPDGGTRVRCTLPR
ncbi:MAG: sensor histidine kinase [Anaerolineae bacterium]|nr:sensor histidine kinase [Anaerolineae bacterium]